jgi:benzoyl-CoA 2,3-dioxygenase component A
MACIPPCPTGSIDNWRRCRGEGLHASPSSWLGRAAGRAERRAAGRGRRRRRARRRSRRAGVRAARRRRRRLQQRAYGATLPPWSAAHAYTNLYGPKAAEQVHHRHGDRQRARHRGRHASTTPTTSCSTSAPCPSRCSKASRIGILPPGTDAAGKPHHARQYSIASPRNGERPGYNNLSLTIKRVLEDHQGRPVRGVASNYMCDLKVGDTVQVIGPFGTSFLMPNHPKSHIVMICTGTGSAPMRAMTEWRRRLRQSGKFEGGKLMLFFGARTKEELPYFGPLQNLPKDFIDINFAFSRTPGQPKRYVQDAMRERAADLAALLKDPNACFYVCGLKAMEEGVVLALRDIAQDAGLDWDTVGAALKREGRLHLAASGRGARRRLRWPAAARRLPSFTPLALPAVTCRRAAPRP